MMILLEHELLFLKAHACSGSLHQVVLATRLEFDLAHLREKFLELHYIDLLLRWSELNSKRAHLIDRTQSLLRVSLGAFLRVSSSDSQFR